MSKILITGNGFDLFHHLPTKYNHFMAVMKTIEDNEFNDKVPFDELFGKKFKERCLEDYNLIIQNYNSNKILLETEPILQIQEMLKNNSWYKYFETIIEIDTWIEFEIEIENILDNLSYFFEFSKNDYDLFKKTYSYETTSLNKYFNNFSFIRDGGTFFSIKNEYVNNRVNRINQLKIIEDLLVSLNDFIVIFNIYISKIISSFYSELNLKTEIPIHLIDKVYTFNYTTSLEKIYNYNDVMFLHGNCHQDNIVLGVSEIPEIIKELKVFGFTKYYQKIRKNINNKFIELPKEKNNLKETIFYIFGHSLDKSDKEYIVDIFKFLELDNNKYSKICIFYYNENDQNNKLNNLLSILDKKIIEDMHKTKRLYFLELNNENITKQFSLNLKSAKVPYV